MKTETPHETLSQLVDERYPIYSEADIIVDSVDGPAEDTVDSVLEAIFAYLHEKGGSY